MDSYNMGFMPAFQDPNRENSTVCRMRSRRSFARRTRPGGRPAGLERRQQLFRQRGIVALRLLRANPQHDRAGLPAPGPLYNRSCVNLASMTDGTSQTAFFSEQRRGQGTPDIKNDMYMMNNAATIDQT